MTAEPVAEQVTIEEAPKTTAVQEPFIEQPRPELLFHDCEIPTKILNQIVGPELQNLLVKDLLSEPDSSVIVIGGTIVKELLSPTIIQNTEHTASSSDLDVIPIGTALPKAKSLSQNNTEFVHRMAELKLDNRIVEILNPDVIRAQDVRSIDEMIQHYKKKKGEKEENEKRLSFLKLLKTTTETLPPEDFQYVSPFKTEGVGIHLSLNNEGQLVGKVHDLGNTLNNRGSIDFQTIRETMDHAIHSGDHTNLIIYNGFEHRSPAYQVLCELLESKDFKPAIDTGLSAINTIFRLMTNHASKKLCLPASLIYSPASLENDLPSQNDKGYSIMYRVAHMLAHSDKEIFSSKNSAEFLAKKGYKNEKEAILAKFQKEFAKSSFTDPAKAMFYALASLPLGNLLSPEIGKVFDKLQFSTTPHTMMLEQFEQLLSSTQSTPNELIARLAPKFNKPEIRSLLKIYDLCLKTFEYENVVVKQSKPITEEQKVEAQKQLTVNHERITHYRTQIAERTRYDHMYQGFIEALQQENYQLQLQLEDSVESIHKELINPPDNISMIYAIMLTSIDLDLNQDQDKIRTAVEEWKQTGILSDVWDNQSRTFNMDIDYAEVIKYMKKFKDIA